MPNDDPTNEERKEEEGTKFFDNLDPWDVFDRQIDQRSANYNPTGGMAERACSSCQWFIAPGSCVVVQGNPDPIVPNGLSDQYLTRIKPDTSMVPIPVMIVDVEDKEKTEVTITVPRSLKATLLAKVTGIIDSMKGTRPSIDLNKAQSFITFKGLDGEWRWFTWTSNKFRDIDNPPEIFEDTAHKEYVAYLDGGGKFPELWLWHEPGTVWGMADWVDYADGFLMHSGMVNLGYEDVAQALSKQKNLGVSHGYHFLHSDEKNGIIGWYRTFEISPMFMKAAANPWTGIAMLTKEHTEMGFNTGKREVLVSLVGEDVVKKFEGQSKTMVAELDRLGVEYKGLNLFDDVKDSDDKSKTPIDYKQLGEEAAKALSELPAFKGLVDGVASMTTEIAGIKTRMDALEKTDDEKIAAKMSPSVKVGVNGGHQASTSDDNTIDKEEAEKQGPSNPNWFNEVVEQIAGPPTG